MASSSRGVFAMSREVANAAGPMIGTSVAAGEKRHWGLALRRQRRL